jgi:eukaryotic-like serine/threonine-protein kinase
VTDLFLPARLQEALGDAYHLERELGGGGMSRLFVATERSLNRQVVVKVLPPELASEVSAARFKQEIEVAAQLQHPHIVPILTAGASGDLLYYIMPFVRGESLRHRLVASGKLPVRDAVRILSEVADALAYAHREGIVHRDIKPENILLEEGHAVLTDFGVARALVAARTSAAREPNLTGTGISVGTPTYMSPEQAAGESSVDSRADLYALGIVGYEMLTGRHPFAATSAQAMIVAHLTEPAPPVARLRPDTPPAVNAAISRALAKKPDERFRTADELRDALEGAGPRERRSRRPVLVAAAAGAALLVAIGALAVRRQRAVPLDANLVAVAPFDVVDADLKLWHEGMVDVLSRNLDGAGPLRTVSPTLVIRRWSGRADRESASALGHATGARLAVFGSLIRSGSDSVRASATVVDVASGTVLGEVERRDALSRMDRLSDSLTIGLLRQLGNSRALAGAQMSSVGTTSLTALKAFLQGEQFFRQSAWDSAIAYYERAIASDSQFSLAMMRGGSALGWVGGSADSTMISYMTRAARFNHGLAPRDSLLVEAGGLFGTLGASRGPPPYETQRRVFATLREAARRYPDDPEVWYALGDAEYHWGWGPEIGVPEREVVRTFDRAIALDSAFTPAYIHPIEMAFRYGTANGRRYLAAYLSQHPTDVEADGMRLAYRLTDPALANAADTRHIIDTASAEQLNYTSAALYEWGDSAETLIRLRRTMVNAKQPGPGRNMDPLRNRQRLASALVTRGHAGEALRLLPEANHAAQLTLIGAMPVRLADSLYLAQLHSTCIECAVSVWGMRGDTVAMQRGLHAADSALSKGLTPEQRRMVPYTVALAHAYLTLARHDTAGAMREFFSLPDSLCHSCGYVWLVQSDLLASQGRYAEAAKVLDELSILPGFMGTLSELKRGRIAEKLNDKPRARDAYAFVADMWRNGDPAFQPYVAEARAGLKRLSGESSATAIPMPTP